MMTPEQLATLKNIDRSMPHTGLPSHLADPPKPLDKTRVMQDFLLSSRDMENVLSQLNNIYTKLGQKPSQ